MVSAIHPCIHGACVPIYTDVYIQLHTARFLPGNTTFFIGALTPQLTLYTLTSMQSLSKFEFEKTVATLAAIKLHPEVPKYNRNCDLTP